MMSKRKEADKIINKHVIWALGGGLIPFPMLDFAAVTAIQMDMLSQITTLYQIKYDASTGKRMVGALTGTTFAKIGSSFLKLIPGIGTVIGGVSMSILSGASTYAIGQVAVEHFESGGDLFNIDLETARKNYDKAFDEGKEVAENLRKAAESTHTADDNEDVFVKLEKLAGLRDKGIITEEEFQAQKEKLLNQV